MSSNASGQVVGYARVSAADQNLARQLSALGDVDRVFEEKISGKDIQSRPRLQEMLAYVREGDTVRVVSADRLARSALDLLEIVRDLREKNVAVEFVDTPALNTADRTGTFMLTVLAAVAELERAMIRDRQAEGIAAAKARGVYDRGTKLTDDQIAQARRRVSDGVPKAVVARDLKVSRSTLYAALSGTGRYDKERG
ncbi:transposase [Glutamicibacter sp. BW78]|uniref:recombinase family protein n=1 Tax=Glutamicibacter sp. BW78 TaxID=2024403 RepID=UPI000BB6D92B|nr:recombinase family protein [Glutamicibacter sp. BW78]PCC26649.1 transposase [Glutamicibacter sp. BW78]